jgi:hypothetical protein
VAAQQRPRSLSASDPQTGMTLDDLAEFVAEMRGHYELPGDTVVRAVGMLEINLTDGPRIARITADPSAS